MSQNPSSQLVAERLDLGEVWEQRVFRWTVPITNRGSGTLRIEQVEGNCTCTAIVPQEFELAPGETQELVLTINLSQDHWGDGESQRPFEVALKARVSGWLNEQSVWLVHGRVQRNPIHVSPAVLDFGTDLIVGAPFPSRELTVFLPQGDGLSNIEAECVPPEAGNARLRETGRPGEFRVDVTPAPVLPRGRFIFSVMISAEGGGKSAAPVKEVVAVGTVQGDIGAEPARIQFGARVVGASAADQVVLFSRQGRPLTVRVAQQSAGVSATLLPDAESQLQVFKILQQFVSVGEHSDTVQFDVGYVDTGEPREIVLVETSYYGTAPSSEPATEQRR
jgi:hypothetical protein